MAPQLARPASTETQIRNFMEDARRRMRHEEGYWTPPPRKRHPYDYTDQRGPCTVTIQGETLGWQPLAKYEGPLGTWHARLGKSIGKPF